MKRKNNAASPCTYHVVWRPQYRRKVLAEGVDVRLQALIEKACRKRLLDIMEREIMPDHVYLLTVAAPYSEPTMR